MAHVKVGTAEAFRVTAIWLDGVKQDAVIEFDDNEGWLVRYAKGNDGRFVDDGDELKTERVTGSIKVDWK